MGAELTQINNFLFLNTIQYKGGEGGLRSPFTPTPLYQNLFLCVVVYLLLASNVTAIQKLSETELKLGIGSKKSWHNMYSGSAYIFIGESLVGHVTL